MLNLYSVTNLDNTTGGVQNRKVKHEDRNPHYYAYAKSADEAIAHTRSYYFADRNVDLDAVLLKENVEHPLGEAAPLAQKAGAQ